MAKKGNRNKARGSSYEREFVQECIELGRLARRVPLSGAMKEYKDDVVVGEGDQQQRVECKYRSDASNFKRLHSWHPGPGQVLVLPRSGLEVYHLADWLDIVAARARGEELVLFDATFKDVTRQSGLLDWLGDADALAVRRPRHPWLICIRAGEQPDE